MSSISHALRSATPVGGDPPVRPPDESGLAVRWAGVECPVPVPVPASDLGDPQAVDAWERRVQQGGPETAVVVSPPILALPQPLLVAAVALVIAASAVARVLLGDRQFSDPLALFATLAAFDAADPRRTAAGRQALLTAAALTLDDSAVAGQTLAAHLRNGGHVGVRAADLAAEHRRRRQELLQATAPADGGRPLAESFDDLPPEAVGLLVPPGYRVGPDGVFHGARQISDVPITIFGLSENVSTHTEEVTIGMRRYGRWEFRTVPSSAVAKRARLSDLADQGLPFTDETASDGVAYLAAVRAANRERLRPVVTAAQLGWGPEFEWFLLGRRLIGNGGTVHFRGADQGDEQAADAYRPGGTFQGWLELFGQAARFPRVLFGVYASFVPPLAPLIGCKNFLNDYSGSTSSGKTTTLQVIASGWGCPALSDPRSVVRSWNMTRVARERWAAVCRHVPVVFDETQLAGDPEQVAQSAYELALGQGRGRGSVDGLRQQVGFETVVFTSGERPLHTFTNDGGVRARVLAQAGSPFGDGAVDPSLPDRLRGQALEHFGHAGERFVRFLIERRSAWGEWKAEFERARQAYQQRGQGNPVAGRMGEYLAAVLVTSRLVHEALAPAWPWADPVEPLYATLTADSADADRSLAALREAVEWAVRHKDRFLHGQTGPDGASHVPHAGWAGVWSCNLADGWHIAFFQQPLRELLREAGYQYEAVVPVWRHRGWLITDADCSGRTQKTVRVGRESVKSVAVTRGAVEQVCGPLLG